MKCYFDGSEGMDSAGDKWLTLAAVAATDQMWAEFNVKWHRMLSERYPVAPFVHMWQIYSGADPFEWGAAGWSQEKVNRLVFSAVDILQQMDKSSFFTFVCSVNLSGRERLVREGFLVVEPSTLCVELGIGSLLTWNTQRGCFGKVWLFFDQGERFVSELRTRWTAGKTGNDPLSPQGSAWDMIADIQEVKMQTHPPVQAADILAWARTRSFSEGKVARLLDEILRAVVPSTTALITEETMRQKSPKSSGSTNGAK